MGENAYWHEKNIGNMAPSLSFSKHIGLNKEGQILSIPSMVDV